MTCRLHLLQSGTRGKHNLKKKKRDNGFYGNEKEAGEGASERSVRG